MVRPNPLVRLTARFAFRPRGDAGVGRQLRGNAEQRGLESGRGFHRGPAASDHLGGGMDEQSGTIGVDRTRGLGTGEGMDDLHQAHDLGDRLIRSLIHFVTFALLAHFIRHSAVMGGTFEDLAGGVEHRGDLCGIVLLEFDRDPGPTGRHLTHAHTVLSQVQRERAVVDLVGQLLVVLRDPADLTASGKGGQAQRLVVADPLPQSSHFPHL